MARIKLVYLGGGSTRAAGTMASFMENGADFDGSEVVLVDLDEQRLALIRTLAEKMARARGPRHRGLRDDRPASRRSTDCDAVLSSFRPGGFAARVLDERIPLEHGADRPGDPGRRAASSWPCARSPCSRTSARRWSASARTRGSSTTRTPSTSSPRRSRTIRRSRSSRSARARSTSPTRSQSRPGSTRRA